MTPRDIVVAPDMWRWPEWIALAERLGIPRKTGTTDIKIWIPFASGGVVKVTHEYYGGDDQVEIKT